MPSVRVIYKGDTQQDLIIMFFGYIFLKSPDHGSRTAISFLISMVLVDC